MSPATAGQLLPFKQSRRRPQATPRLSLAGWGEEGQAESTRIGNAEGSVSPGIVAQAEYDLAAIFEFIPQRLDIGNPERHVAGRIVRFRGQIVKQLKYGRASIVHYPLVPLLDNGPPDRLFIKTTALFEVCHVQFEPKFCYLSW